MLASLSLIDLMIEGSFAVRRRSALCDGSYQGLESRLHDWQAEVVLMRSAGGFLGEKP